MRPRALWPTASQSCFTVSGVAVPTVSASGQSFFEAHFTKIDPPPDNTPDNVYAQIAVGDRNVATIYNGGTVEMADGSKPPSDLVAGTAGPDLAAARAEQLAKELGGSLAKANSAQSADQWTSTHALTHYLVELQALDQATAAAEHGFKLVD